MHALILNEIPSEEYCVLVSLCVCVCCLSTVLQRPSNSHWSLKFKKTLYIYLFMLCCEKTPLRWRFVKSVNFKFRKLAVDYLTLCGNMWFWVKKVGPVWLDWTQITHSDVKCWSTEHQFIIFEDLAEIDISPAYAFIRKHTFKAVFTYSASA